MFRYKVVKYVLTPIVGGELQAYQDLLARDEQVIAKFLEVIAEVQTTDVKSLSELTLTTKKRTKVVWDVKAEFDISHNEAQECLWAALRIVKREFSGYKDGGVLTRVVNKRRLRLDKERNMVKLLPRRIQLQVQELPEGEVLSVRLFADKLLFHLSRIDVPAARVVGIDIGKQFAVVVMRDEQVESEQVFSSELEVLAYLRNFRGATVKVGLPETGYRKSLQAMYHELLEEGHVVLVVNESYTSVTCSTCGREGKRYARLFWCQSCERHMHADTNAAVNIAGREKA